MILSMLKGVEERKDHYLALCPAHVDTSPSLKVTITPDKTLVHCWAGCRTIDVLQALGLTWKDLFSEDAPYKEKSEERRISEAVVESIRRQT